MDRAVIPSNNYYSGSSHRIVFQNIPAGAHNLRIVAENNRKDKITVKIKIYVSGTESSSCAVNLINNRITYMDNSVLIHFKGTNSVDQFRCRLNKEDSFNCKHHYVEISKR